MDSRVACPARASASVSSAMALFPCSSCARHVRIADAACPFCGTALPADAAARVVPAVPARRRLDRAATFAFATTLVAAACGGSTSDAQSGVDAGKADSAVQGDAATKSDAFDNDSGTVQAAYGAPFDAALADAKNDVGNVQPPYGLPPMDAGTDGD